MENRIIKFRAWNVVTKAMVDLQKITPLILNIDTQGLFIPFSDGLILMQFTGLLDKNKKEIYEGDELMYIATNMSSMTVKFKEGCFVGEGPFNTLPLIDYINAADFQSIEVIGNIYESHSLLQKKEGSITVK